MAHVNELRAAGSETPRHVPLNLCIIFSDEGLDFQGELWQIGKLTALEYTSEGYIGWEVRAFLGVLQIVRRDLVAR